MCYQVKNLRTGKFIKDGITGKTKVFTDKETAENFAQSAARDSVLNATAWNSVRKSIYKVIEV